MNAIALMANPDIRSMVKLLRDELSFVELAQKMHLGDKADRIGAENRQICSYYLMQLEKANLVKGHYHVIESAKGDKKGRAEKKYQIDVGRMLALVREIQEIAKELSSK